MEKMEGRSSAHMPSRQSRDENGEEFSLPLSTLNTKAGSMENIIDISGSISGAEQEHEYLSGFMLYLVMFSLVLVGFLMLLDTSVVSTAIPKITSHFHSLDDVGWYGTSYLLTNCALQPLTGKIYAQVSSKWTFLTFFAIFELGSLVCGAATSSKMLIVGRAIAGLGASGILNGCYTIVHAIVPVKKQPTYLGVLVGIAQLGLVSGPLVGGALTQYVTWRWCFYINLPCGGAVAAILLFITIPEHKDKKYGKQTLFHILRKLDLIGFSLFTPTTIQFILALQWGGTKYSWDSATVIGLFCGAFGNLLVFLAWEYYMGDEAMIPFSIIKRRVIWSSCLNYGCFVGSVLISTYYLPIYFQSVRNATPTMSGVDILPQIITCILFVVGTGVLVGRVGYYIPFAIASGALGVLGSGLITTWSPTTVIGTWIGYQIIQGAWQGLGFQMPILAVQNNASTADIPIVTAMAVFSQNLGGVIFLTLAQVIFSNRLRTDLLTYAPGINPDLVIAAGATGVRSSVPAALLPGVLLAYSKAFDHVMYLAAGSSGGAFLFSFGMGWVRIKTDAAGPVVG